MLLEPAVTSFPRRSQMPAALDDDLEICVGDRQDLRHGAGQMNRPLWSAAT